MTEDEAKRSIKHIKTSYACPPIPFRGADWCAYFDGEEETGNYGYGETEQDAIDDLLESYGPHQGEQR